MDVSIAVSLIRGQMGAVVERAVNVAVETVLAEMLKVVGVKFEELKAQVKTLRRDAAALQAEKTLKDKENDKMRAALRLAEAKLSYYQRAVELHVQHRAATNATTRTHRTTGEAPPRATQESLSSDAQRIEDEVEDDWSVSLQHTEANLQQAPPPAQAPPPDPGLASPPPPLSPDGSTQADSSTLLCPQVKQEETQQQEEEEVICIKEEPEEEQQVVATLLLDCHLQQSQLQAAQGQSSVADWSEFPVQRNLPDPSTHTPSYTPQQPVLTLPMAPTGVCARQAVRPWTKDLSLYEEYKLRRNELRRRSLSRRREMEKTLPQPLLADLVRERREKTRLRVARWRAKRKLQACLQQQAPGGAAALSQSVCPISSQQQLRASCGSVSGVQQRCSALPQCSSFLLGGSSTSSSSSSGGLPFIPPASSSPPSSSSSLLLGAHSVAEHIAQQAVTSSSCSSYPQVSLSQQSLSLTDAELFQ